MKSLKIVFASLFLAVGAIAISSFTVKNYKSNAFAIKCYDYTISTSKTDLRPANANFVDATEFKTTAPISSWTLVTDNPSVVCADGTKICRLCFDDTQLVGVTLSDLFEDTRSYIVANGEPGHGVPFVVNVNGIANITVTIYEQPL